MLGEDGSTVSLAAFRGRPVVLTFMDPHCTDICPIVSAEFLAAYHDLGPAAARAVFIAVNVNPYFRPPADVAAFSRAHQLTSIPSWHFLTGSLTSLRAVWDEYEIAVQAPSRTADVVHTSLVYFIDPSGRERYVAVPMDEHTASKKAYMPTGDLAAWGRGVALVTRSLAASPVTSAGPPLVGRLVPAGGVTTSVRARRVWRVSGRCARPFWPDRGRTTR